MLFLMIIYDNYFAVTFQRKEINHEFLIAFIIGTRKYKKAIYGSFKVYYSRILALILNMIKII